MSRNNELVIFTEMFNGELHLTSKTIKYPQMKNTFYLLLLLLIVASCQKPNKIGYIDNSELINEYQEKKDLEARLQSKQEKLKRRADSIALAYKIDYQAADAKSKKARSQKEFEKISQEFSQKWTPIQDQLKYQEQNMTKDFQSEIDSLIIKVKDFIKDYGKKNGYTFILGTSDGASSVIYGEDQTNLTQTILDALNAEYKKE